MIANKWVSLQKTGLHLKTCIQVNQISDSVGNICEICVFSIDCRDNLHLTPALGTASE